MIVGVTCELRNRVRTVRRGKPSRSNKLELEVASSGVRAALAHADRKVRLSDQTSKETHVPYELRTKRQEGI